MYSCQGFGKTGTFILLVGIYIGTILVEDNLTISMDNLKNGHMLPPRNLATRVLIAMLLIVMKNVEASLM